MVIENRSSIAYQQHVPVVVDYLEKNFRADWMNDADWKDCQSMLEVETGLSFDVLTRVLALGVSNGYLIETQLAGGREELARAAAVI